MEGPKYTVTHTELRGLTERQMEEFRDAIERARRRKLLELFETVVVTWV